LWGGGVDCCLAYWKAANVGLDVKYFYTAIPENYDRVSSYGLKTDLITIQAESMGVTPILKRIDPENYEQFLIESLQKLKQMNVEGVVFKCIDLQDEIELQELWDWGDCICKKVGIQSYYPIWKSDQRQLLQEFIDLGFKAIVIAVNSDFFGPVTLGREIDESWIRELDKLGNVSYCATENEYYTMVYDGPLFKKKIKITQNRKFRRNNYWLLDITARCLGSE